MNTWGYVRPNTTLIQITKSTSLQDKNAVVIM